MSRKNVLGSKETIRTKNPFSRAKKFQIVFLWTLTIVSILGLFQLSQPPAAQLANFSAKASSAEIETWIPPSPASMNANISVEMVFRTTLSYNFDEEKIPLLSATTSTRGFFDRDYSQGSLYVDPGNQIIFNNKETISLGVLDPNKHTDIEIHIKGTEVWAITNGHISYTNGAAPVRFMPDSVSIFPTENKTIVSSQVSLSMQEIEPISYSTTANYVLSILAGGSLGILVFIYVSRALGKIVLRDKVAVLINSSAFVVLVFYLVSISTVIFGLSANQLVPEDVRFSDFFQIDILSRAEPYLLANSNYPPFPIALAKAFSLLPARLLFIVVFVGAMGSIIGILFATLRTNTRISGFLPPLILALSFPVIFGLDRGNLELPTVALIMWAVVFTKLRMGKISTILLGFATALKLFPMILFGPLISNKKYRTQLIWSAIVAVILTGLSGLVFGLGPLEILKRLLSTGSVGEMAISQKESWGYSLNSGLLLSADVLFRDLDKLQTVNVMLGSRTWLVVTAGAWLLCLVWATFIEKEVWRKVAISSAATLVFAGTTFQYRGAILLLPILVLALTKAEVKAPKLLGVLFGITLAPIGLKAIGHTDSSTISSILLPITVLSLLVYLLLTSSDLRIKVEHFAQIVFRLKNRRLILVSLASFGLILIATSMFIAKADSKLSWFVSESTYIPQAAKTFVGQEGGNVTISFPAQKISSKERNLRLKFIGSEGITKCPTVSMNVSNDKFVITVNSTDTKNQFEKLVFRFDSTHQPLKLTAYSDGKTFLLESPDRQSQLSLSEKACFNLSRPELSKNIGSPGLAFTWWQSNNLAKLTLGIGVFFITVTLILLAITGLFRNKTFAKTRTGTQTKKNQNFKTD